MSIEQLKQSSPELYSTESLLAIAHESEQKYKALLKEFPPGTVCEERNNCYDRSQQALVCAAWLEKKKLSALRFVGPFGTHQIFRGSRVRIKSGSLVFSTDPSIGSEGVLLKKAQSITVRWLDRGYVLEGGVFQPRVVWSGTGSYWRWTDINNIDFEFNADESRN